MQFVILVFVILLLSLIYFNVVRWCLKQYVVIESANKLPVLAGSVPIFGHLFLVLKHRRDLFPVIEKWTRDMQDKSQNVAVFWLGPVPFVCILDPNDALKMSNECLEKANAYNFASSWARDKDYETKYGKWNKNRKLITPSFNPMVLNSYLTVFNEAGYTLLDRVESHKGFFDPIPLLEKINIEVLCRTILGLPKNSSLVTEFEADLKRLFRFHIVRFTNLLYHSDIVYRFSKMFSLEQEIIAKFKAFSQKIINDKNKMINETYINGTIASYVEPNYKFKPFLDLLLKLRDQGSMTKKEVQEELQSMIVAGYDTSYSALSFILPLLGMHQDVQQRVYEELESIFGDSNRDVNKDDLSKMVYFDAVIKESLRLYPIVPIIGRRVTKTIQLQNFTVERGCDSIFMVYGINTHRRWGEDRYQFNPDRWLREKLPEHAFASFGVGRRNCLGMNFSFMLMKTVLCHLIRRYRISKDQGDLTTEYTIICKPKTGHKIKLERRQ